MRDRTRINPRSNKVEPGSNQGRTKAKPGSNQTQLCLLVAPWRGAKTRKKTQKHSGNAGSNQDRPRIEPGSTQDRTRINPGSNHDRRAIRPGQTQDRTRSNQDRTRVEHRPNQDGTKTKRALDAPKRGSRTEQNLEPNSPQVPACLDPGFSLWFPKYVRAEFTPGLALGRDLFQPESTRTKPELTC